ncbi:hypothetical protein AW736_20770 [Termitidicoccus mucosus]|uniref:Rhodanese domain-containing protein n=2 Tax=Termitidicoccus mucosus TaxID=1184151 RepID=A0A178IEW1_9BACT|nr:hypothetical protein AW736_20770 [Opitutaceae bacterium TSB47]
MTFAFFFAVSLGVNQFRGAPMSVLGGKTHVDKDHGKNEGMPENWKYCNLSDMDSFKATGDLLIIDARPGLFYKYGHIPGAISLPAQTNELGRETGKVLSGVPGNRTIVIYCADAQCENAETVAGQVSRHGYGNIYIFSGGWSEWTETGRPVEK